MRHCCAAVCVALLSNAVALRLIPRRVRFWKGKKTPVAAPAPAATESEAGRSATPPVERIEPARANSEEQPWAAAPAAAGSEVASHGRSATPRELERIEAARSSVDDPWVKARSDRELLPFSRACATADELTKRLRDTAAWRNEWALTTEDWSFATFFANYKDAFYDDDGNGALMEWLPAFKNAPEATAPATTDEGASLLILRPARYKLGTIPKEDWLRLVAWQGSRATSEWPCDRDAHKPGHGTVAIIVDRTGSGVRNQDPRLLRFLLPPLIKHYPSSLQRAYVGPVNAVFYGIWAVATFILPRRVAGRFMLLRGADWKKQLRGELGAELSAKLPANLREGGS